MSILVQIAMDVHKTIYSCYDIVYLHNCVSLCIIEVIEDDFNRPFDSPDVTMYISLIVHDIRTQACRVL